MTEAKCFYCERMLEKCDKCNGHSEFIATPESEDEEVVRDG
jgi:hypothetical protein